MRILLVNDFGYPVGGAESYFFSLAAELKSRSHEVRTLSSDSTRHGSEFLTDQQVQHTGHMFDLDSLFNIRARSQVSRAVQEFRPEVIHPHNIFYTISPSILFALRSTPTVMTLHDYALICAGDKRLAGGSVCEYRFGECGSRGCLRRRADLRLRERVKRAVARKGLERVTHLIAPSRYVGREFERNGYSGVEVLHHPCKHSPDGAPGLPAARAGTFIYVGRLAPQKGLPVLLNAFQLVRSKHPEAELCIVGGGPQEAELKTLAEKLELGGSIRFTGRVAPEQVDGLLKQSAVLVLPSVWPEVAGLALYEAAANGVPAIASEVGGIPEFITDGKNGTLFRPGDAAQLAQKMSRIITHPEAYAAMRADAAAALADYTWPKHLDRLQQIYETAAAR